MIQQFLVLAIFGEAVVSVIRWAMQKGFNRWRVLALAVCITIATLAGVDLFTTVGIPLTRYVPAWAGALIGSIFTGIMAARGSTVAFDLFKAIQEIGSRLKTQEGATIIR